MGDGKRFNQGKKNIMKDLGFSKAELEQFKRTDGHTDKCHEVFFYKKGKRKLTGEQVIS